VINPKGLNVRSKPDTATGQVIRSMTMGEAFTAVDVMLVKGTETWARLTSGDSVIQQYCMIGMVGRPQMCREVASQGVPVTASQWQTALDVWARLQGYDGPKP
jgi:hypothetical protein